MAYIIFLLTIQTPFLYFIWKLFNNQSVKIYRNLQILKKQNEHIANFMDTLRMSVEKISDDIYSRNGVINSRLSEIEKEMRGLKSRIRQMELYTGLSTKDSIEEISSSTFIKDKEFK